ncbi:MAG: S8 family peptidase [Acidobacteriota bacterium]
MTNTIDPRLKFLQRENRTTLDRLEPTGRFGLAFRSARATPTPRARVLLHFRGDGLARAEGAGFEVGAVAGDVATGAVELDRLEELAGLPEIVRIESSRPMAPEIELSTSEIRADRVWKSSDDGPGYRGAGVVIGIVDSGLDYRHPRFRHADGTSRILAIWDQALEPVSGEKAPEGFDYGVEYLREDINRALDAREPGDFVRHGHDPNLPPIVNRARLTHGTRVADIAAGASPDGDLPSGVAPAADLIFVANSNRSEALGDSANTLDAIAYVFAAAEALGKPAVVNLSQGDHIGPHDGTSLLERGIDHLLEAPGRSVVKSAGNSAGRGAHASGRVESGKVEGVELTVSAQDRSPDTVDLWFSDRDSLALRVVTPRGDISETVLPGETRLLELPGGNSVFVDSVLGDPGNGSNRLYLQMSPGSASHLEAGTWTLELEGLFVEDGFFDAWIERGTRTPQFLRPHRSDASTVSIPGTSRRVLTVGSSVIRGRRPGGLSAFSSRGPTRDGRTKPEVVAPGESILSALPSGGRKDRGLGAGTSLAAPQVAGVVALMLEKKPVLTQAEIRRALEESARGDGSTGGVPNSGWGFGKLDAEAALARTAPAPDPAGGSTACVALGPVYR